MSPKWNTQQMPSQKGKTFLITGANSGIGFQTALALAKAGAKVLMACRNAQKGEQALARLKAATDGSQVEVVLVDMASLAGIHSFAAEFVQRGMPLDVLVNNAGVMAIPQREVTEDGFERQFGTNHLGHFALTGLLFPALLRAPAPRVVTVASLAHRNGRMDWSNLQGEQSYSPWGAYNASKLANILFARDLERRAHEQGLALQSNAVHPGVSRTNIFENGPGTGGVKAQIMRIFAPVLTQDDAMGALPMLYAATMPDVAAGAYIGPDGIGELKGFPAVVKPRPQALDSAAGKRLWEVSEQLTGVRYLD